MPRGEKEGASTFSLIIFLVPDSAIYKSNPLKTDNLGPFKLVTTFSKTGVDKEASILEILPPGP